MTGWLTYPLRVLRAGGEAVAALFGYGYTYGEDYGNGD
jgi:hypothetical protein